MKRDRLSRFYGSVVFHQKKDRISASEIEDIQDQLLQHNIYSHLDETPNRYILKTIRGDEPQQRRKIFRHLILFILTIGTTTITGAMLRGRDPFASLADFSSGLEYSFALMTILLFHEMGHYIASRFYGVQVTLPYFIPLFLPTFHPGTLGAFIKMRSAIPNKRALLDIGIAGPLAGFVMSVLFLIIGFNRLPDATGIWAYIETIHPIDSPQGVNLTLGNTLLYDFIASFFDGQRLPMNEMYHFPFIFAGWFGLLVTALNLMPIGQLDGGHITYALFEDRARFIAIAGFILLILLNVYVIYNYNSFIWVLWPILILIFIRFRHPPTLDNSIQPDGGRRWLGWLAYLIFIISFSPMPIYLAN